jgi:ATP-dependent Clp protease ATP-binding subunit ClpA
MELQFTDVVPEVMRRATGELERLGHDSLRAEHILLGVLTVSDGSASAVLDSLGLDRSEVRSRIEALLPRGDRAGPQREYPIHASGQAVLEHAMAQARESGTGMVTTARILLGILALDDSPSLHAIAATGVAIPSLRSRLQAHAEDPE